MEYYVGIDVSLKEVFISILDSSGKVVKEGPIKNSPSAIDKFLVEYKGKYEKIGLESGQFSIYLCTELRKLGYEVICVDARHMAAGLSARINKNDKNDARGIANMMRAGLYKEVYIKSSIDCERNVLLCSRRQLVEQRKRIRNMVRGSLKTYGYVLPVGISDKKFVAEVRRYIDGMSKTVQLSFTSTLSVLDAVTESIAKLDKELIGLAKSSDECKLLMTVPGVGPVTAMTFIATIGDEKRFDDSEMVGAYVGLTPKQYASGEVNRQGHISRMGSSECRSMLYEAANILLARYTKKCDIRTWGLKLAKKKGRKKAIVAVARKLAVTMHRMLVDKAAFRPQAA